MKLKVIETFVDKYNHSVTYRPGTILDVDDKERAADLTARGLCVEYKGRKAADAEAE